MNKEFFSIVFTIVIVAAVLSVWLVGRQNGWFIHKSANDFEICRNEAGDTLCFNCKNFGYGITGISMRQYNDDILHVELNIHRENQSIMEVSLDTVNVRYVRLYDKTIPIKEIATCK